MHLAGRLLNEWFINMFCRMEDERLSVIKSDQEKRMARREELLDFVSEASTTPTRLGKKYYVPASVTGSSRHLRRLRTDALELARRKKAPDFFVTLTCNPRWPEIAACLAEGQTAADRPDVVV